MMLKYRKQHSHILKYILNELLNLIEIFNSDIVGKQLSNIYIALDKDGRNLHNFSSLRAPCDETNFTPDKL